MQDRERKCLGKLHSFIVICTCIAVNVIISQEQFKSSNWWRIIPKVVCLILIEKGVKRRKPNNKRVDFEFHIQKVRIDVQR